MQVCFNKCFFWGGGGGRIWKATDHLYLYFSIVFIRYPEIAFIIVVLAHKG